jgi:hypothetical protein
MHNRAIVFLDMDGVLADFFRAFADWAGVNHWKELTEEELAEELDRIIGSDFFANIPKTSSCDQIIQLALGFSGSYSILSSPLRNDEENTIIQKKIWIQKNLSPLPEEIFIVREKSPFAQYQGTKNILIDDRPDNIIQWKEAGGFGIRYQANKDDIELIEKELINIQL